MADIQANIGINLDTTRALAQLKNLQRQISVFNTEMVRGGGKSAIAAAGFQQELVNSINATGQFSASLTKVSSTTEAFTNALEKNKLSMGQTFRYAGAASKKFSHLFTNEFNTIEKVARERVKTIQTQYIKMGRDANGAIRAIAVRPLALDMNNLATQTAMAAQKQQILNQLLRQGSTNLLNWGKNTQWAGRQLMVGFTIPLALFGSAASKSFMELEEQAIRFKRVYGDLFTTPQQADQAFADMQRLGQEFTKYGVAVEKTIGLAASVAQMGKTGAELTAQVTEATRLAVLGGMEQEDALNTTISLTNAFGVAAEDLTEKINFLNAAENQTILSIQDFNEAVPRAGSVVAQLGGDVEDLAFFLTAMREGGIEASQGANALKTSLGRLVNPTARARQELAAYGIDIVGIVERNAGNLRETVLQLGTALDELDPLEKSRAIERLFGKFQFARMSALFNNIMDEGSQAAAVLDLINSSASDLSTIANRELGRVEQSAATQFRSAIEQFQAALAPIGESFLKLVTPVIEFGTKVLKAFNNLSDGTKSFIVGLVGVVGAIGPVLLMGVGLLANGIANLLKMFLGLQTVFQRIRSGSKGVADQTEYMTQQQLEAAAAADSLGQKHSNLRQIFTSEKIAIDNLVAAYTKMTTAQRNSLGIPQMVRTTTAAVPGMAKGRKVPGYKDGVVMVPGPKGAGDIQPAMLAPGEAVIPAEMAEKYGPLINAMIAGNIPGYITGKTNKASPSTEKTSQSNDPEASHIKGDSPGELAASAKELADAGYTFAAEVRDMSESADGLSVEIDLVKGNLHELAEITDNVFFTGETFPGTTTLETKQRNAMYTAAEKNKYIGGAGIFTGIAPTYDELQEQATILAKEQAKNTKFYRTHRAAIDGLIKEANEARAVMDQSTDQERAKLEYAKKFSRTAIAQALQAKQGLSQAEAEEEAGRRVQRAEELYEKKILEGHSAEEALRLATLDLKAARWEAAKNTQGRIEATVAPKELGTDWPRSDAASKGRPTNPTQLKRQESLIASGQLSARVPLVVRNFTAKDTDSGLLNPKKGISAKALAAATEQEYLHFGKIIVEAMREGLRTGFQSSSPSKVTEKEMKNAVDGAVKALREGQDDMQQGGQQLAEATQQGFNNFGTSGTSSRRRGDPSRVRTAGDFTTPGQPIAFDIAGGKEIQAAQKQLAVSTRMSSQNIANLAVSAINGANKIGSIGIAVSSLAGGLSMVEGPLGDFASKLFPITSVITGLSFAMNFLSAETVKHNIANAASRIAEERNTVAKIINTRATQAETVAKTVNAGATSVVTGTVAKVGTGFANLGTRMLGFLRTVGSATLGLLGISATTALVVAGLAVVIGGLYLLNKVIQDQKAKISGLGDAANMSADRLKGLSEALGVSGSGAREATIASAQSSAVSGTLEEQKEIVNTRDQFLELIETNDEFKKEWKGTVAALKSGTDEMAQATLEMLAVTLQTEGYTEEQISGVVLALKELAGKTNVEIDFSSISIETQTGAIDTAAQNFVNSISESVGRYKAYSTIMFDEAALDAFSSSLASAVINANAQFDAGLITLDQYEAQLEQIRLTLASIGEGSGIEAQTEAVEGFIAELEAMGFEGIAEDTAGLIESGTSRGLDAALAVGQARAAGVSVSESELAALEAGSQEGASERALGNTRRVTAAIQERTAAQKELAAESARQAEIDNQIQNLPSDIEKETDAIRQQSDVFNDSYDMAKKNAEIKNALAVAEKVAADEVTRLAFEQAVANGTAEEFLATLDEQISLENELKAARDLAGLQAQVEQQKQQKVITDGLSTALGDSALAQEMMNNAQYAGIISSALLKAGFDATTDSAEDLAAALSSEEVQAAVALIREAMTLAGSAPKSGGGGTPKSFLDDIVKGLRDTANAQTRVTEGFNASLRAITSFSKAGVAGLNGLSSQLRRAGASEPFIDLILGMDPKDWEREKRRLFNFNADGTVADLTAAGQAVQDAINTAEIGKFINEQDRLTVSVGNQIDAITKLTSAGASYEAAYEAVQNTAFATAVATATSAEQITAAAEAAMSAMRKMQELQEINEEEERKKRISEAIREQNKEFSNQAKILDYITNNRSELSEAQMSAILNNKDLQSLVLEPSIDPRALAIALNNAQEQADLELRIKRLTTEGQEDIFQEGVSNAMSAFGALEREIELEFQAKIKDDGSLVQDAERQIALIDFELDDYQAGLDEIDRLEQDINDVYDKRIEALDKVAELNDDIARSQEAQLEVADALSQGDIAAAARAAQQSRQIEQENAREAQTRMLEEQRAADIAALRSSSGLSREQLQDRIRDLEEQIFNIEERTLEPAQERIRLAELTRDDQIASLEVLNKTREEWDRISNSVDVAQANGWRFADSMQESLNIVEKLVDSLTNRPAPPPPASVPSPAPTPARSSSPASAPAPASDPGPSQLPIPTDNPVTVSTPNSTKKTTIVVDKDSSRQSTPTTTVVKNTSSLKNEVLASVIRADDRKFAALKSASKRAYGGIVGRTRSGPPQQYFDGGRVKGPGTERSDSIPAMLSNGEYVVQARAVRQIGTAFLDMLNGGKVVPQSKDGVPAFRTGGYVNTSTLAGILKASGAAPKKYTPPVSIRQAERAASTPAPRAPLISAGKNPPPPPAPSRRPSTASAPRTSQPVAPPRPAPAPAVITQDTRTPLAKVLDQMAASPLTNYLPDPKKAIRDAIDIFLPFTSESMKNSETGLPTASGLAADAALVGAGGILGKLAAPVAGAISKILKVPTVAVPAATAATTSTATRTSSRSILDIIREETRNLSAGTSFIGSRPAPFGRPVNFDDTKLNFEANLQTRRATNVAQSKQMEDYVVEYARQNNKTIVEAITDANDAKLMNNVFPENFNTNGDQAYLINQINELETLLAKPPVEAQAIEKILPAQGYLDSKILAPFRAMDRLFASRARTQSSGFSQLGNSRIYQGAVGLLPPNLRAIALTATARHRSGSSVLGDPGNLLNPKNVPVVSGRVFGPGTYLAQTQKLSDELFGSFGDNVYRVGMSPTVLKRLFSSKGYITPTELRKRGLHIGDDMSMDHPTIRTLMNEGYVGYQHGDALTNWLIGGDSAFNLVPTTAKAIADSGASLRSRLNAVQQYTSFFEKAMAQRKLLSANPATSIPRIKPTQSSEFIKGSSLTRLNKAPKDVDYHMGQQAMVSSFAEDASGKKLFVKGHLKERYAEPDEVSSSFTNEFLAGRIGNYIGANTPQAYIVQRSAGDVALGSNMRRGIAQPFEIATDVVPSSHNLSAEHMKNLVLNSDNPYKALDEIFEGFIDYSKTTPALNAVMGNSDLHYGNILWSNSTKKFNQIDFNEARPTNLKMAPGVPGNHPDIRKAITIAKTSMAIIRDAMRHSVDAALENNLLTQSQQLALISKMNASGFKLPANKNATDPLFDTIPDITTTQDYTSLFQKIANFDEQGQIPSAIKNAQTLPVSNRTLDPWILKTIKERAEVLSEFGNISLRVGDHPLAAQRMAMRPSPGFMAGGFVKSRNTDNIPAMLTAGEYVVRRSAVQSFGADNLEKINNGTYNDGSMYNYNLAVNVKSDADPNKIARTVMTSIKSIESQRIRGNNL